MRTSCWNHSDVMLREQALREVGRVQTELRDVRENVEGALRLNHRDPRDALQAAEHVLATEIKLRTHVLYRSLITLERRESAGLGE